MSYFWGLILYMKKLLFALILFSCTKDVVEPEGKGDVEIRIWNDSKYEFDEVFVDTKGGENDYGNLIPGNHSAYKKFISAYRYAFVSFKIDGKAYSIQPIDYVGEEQLLAGKYTYKISISDPKSQFALLEFIED
jgi:hypothetical protein